MTSPPISQINWIYINETSSATYFFNVQPKRSDISFNNTVTSRLLASVFTKILLKIY